MNVRSQMFKETNCASKNSKGKCEKEQNTFTTNKILVYLTYLSLKNIAFNHVLVCQKRLRDPMSQRSH